MYMDDLIKEYIERFISHSRHPIHPNALSIKEYVIMFLNINKKFDFYWDMKHSTHASHSYRELSNAFYKYTYSSIDYSNK